MVVATEILKKVKVALGAGIPRINPGISLGKQWVRRKGGWFLGYMGVPVRVPPYTIEAKRNTVVEST